MSDKLYVVVKDAGLWGIEMHLLSLPCETGQLAIYACETEPPLAPGCSSPSREDHKLEVFYMDALELEAGRTTLGEDDENTAWILKEFEDLLRNCEMPIPTFVYCQEDTQWLRELREAPTLSPRDVHLLRTYCPALYKRTPKGQGYQLG